MIRLFLLALAAFALACPAADTGTSGLPAGVLNDDGTIDAGTYVNCGEDRNVEDGDEVTLQCSTVDGAGWSDADGDGFAPCECDCDDDDDGVNPDIVENSLSDSIDQDCDNYEFIVE